jgi:tetratricopeptide (TPR) repeat protein
MTFDEILAQVLAVLQREGRVSYRTLRRRFNLDEEYLEDIKVELIHAKQVARDEEGVVLVWAGMSGAPPAQEVAPASSEPSALRPIAYTPRHLAERILALLAETSAKSGQTAEGLEALAEALTTLANSTVQWWEAELYRLKGELLLQHAAAQPEEAEACFQQALAVARRQQAKLLEMRAAMSLARLWQRQGKGAAVRQWLAEIYGWFTEGFDTADLQEAKALLEALV